MKRLTIYVIYLFMAALHIKCLNAPVLASTYNDLERIMKKESKELIPELKNRFDGFISKSMAFETGGDKSGAYHNDPQDMGGETKWGISKRAFPNLDISKLTFNQAKVIYYDKYYDPILEHMTIPDSLAFKVFDMSILLGPNSAVKALQRALNTKADSYLKEDGIMGPMTRTALLQLNRISGMLVYEEYVKLIKNKLLWISLKRFNKKFYKGWIKRAEYFYGRDVTKK